MSEKTYLRHYTSLPVLFEILINKQLFLSDPSRWADKNDIYYLRQYKDRYKLKSLLALCFSIRPETHHHWKIYANGIAGVCIKFDKSRLKSWLDNYDDIILKREGVRLRKATVKYPPYHRHENTRPTNYKLPFFKRYAFRDEGEYRIIYQHKHNEVQIYPIRIELNLIENIRLSPDMPENVVQTVSRVIRSIKGCMQLDVEKSSVFKIIKRKRLVDDA